MANSKQKVFSRTHNVVKYTPKNFAYDYTLYCLALIKMDYSLLRPLSTYYYSGGCVFGYFLHWTTQSPLQGVRHSFFKSFWLQFLASYFRTTVRNGYNTVLLDKIYVNLRILTYIVKWDVPCLV